MYLVILFFLVVQAVSAQSAGSATPAHTALPEHDYILGPGDNLMISVNGLKEFDETIRVSNSGRIHLRYLGVVQVARMTTRQLEAEIGNRLRERQLVKNPWVLVRVTEYRAHPVYILGEVMQPGQFLLKSDMYVVDLIALAAGFNEVATPVGYLYRRKADSTAPEAIVGAPATEADEAIPIDFRQLYDGTHPELNMRLQAGDVLYVPQRREELFFVAGDVFKPGVFKIGTGDEVLASQAIARAGGPLKTAKMHKGILVRNQATGERQQIEVDFHAILIGKRPDVPVKANDIIYIPGSASKSLAYGLLGIVPGIAHGAILIR